MWRNLVKLARPHQWAKSVFVLVGPIYAMTDGKLASYPGGEVGIAWSVAVAAACFCLASSGCYVFNDLADAEADRAHPRKRRRPIASGAVDTHTAVIWGSVLVAMSIGLVWLLPIGAALLVLGLLVLHVVNVSLYSKWLKHRVIADVMSLSMGFVLRVLAGCAAVGVMPSTWLLNSTLFVAMFLAFGKRLGERRTMGEAAAAARGVQQAYSDQILRMMVVVTAVATLLTYAGYTQSKDEHYRLLIGESGFGINVLWLTILPAMYGLLRAILLLEQGRYDDPTEMAVHDRPFQLAALVFAAVTAVAVLVAMGPG